MLEPLSPSDWTRQTAAHLAARAGFGATPKEIDHLTDLGVSRAVEGYFDFPAEPSADPPAWTTEPPPDPREILMGMRELSTEERQQAIRNRVREQRFHVMEMAGWWLERMVNGAFPLQEKLALFWHGHFATSIVKVRNARFMWQQNETFRRLAAGSWREMLGAIAEDPAMLVWLDGANSRAGKPNENFARELMELFTLGEGHYTESDIKESARAFTGYSLARGRQSIRFEPRAHDDGEKIFFGHRGKFDGPAILDILVEQPQADRFITSKMWQYFSGASVVPEPFAASLADRFRVHARRFGPWLAEVFRSRAFYHPALMAAQVKSPVQWYVSTVRLTDRELPPPGVAQSLLTDLGQVLFAPPNVKGWDEGPAWITVSSLVARFDHGKRLVDGGEVQVGSRRPGANRFDRTLAPAPIPSCLAGLNGMPPAVLADALESAFLAVPLQASRRQLLINHLGKDASPSGLTQAVALVVSTPEFQLT